MINRDFVVSLDGLKAGRTAFGWHSDGKFFGGFENSEILDADLSVDATVEKSGKYIGVDCSMRGTVTVACDRCLSDLELPVETEFKLSVKFGQEGGASAEGEREIVMLPEGDAELDLSQTVYDYVCLSLPMQRVHPEGECDPEVVKYLGTEDDAVRDLAEPAANPFSSLKNLF